MNANSRSLLTNQFAPKYHLVFTLCVLCAFVANFEAQDFRHVHPGVEYTEVQHKIGDDPSKINLLRLDLKKVRLDVHHANDAAIGLETTSSIAKRKGAVAAINAGFFRLDTSEFAGDAAGVLQIDGQLLSESQNNRIALGLLNGARETTVMFGHLETKLTLFLGIDTSYQISGINRERKENELVIFNPLFGRSTLTDPRGAEFLVKSDKKKGNVGNVESIWEGKGNVLIPRDGYILSASGDLSRDLSYFFAN
jgi:hypothetical protein